MRHILLQFASLVWPPLLLALILVKRRPPRSCPDAHLRAGGPPAREARGGRAVYRVFRRGDARFGRRADEGDAARLPRDGHRLVRGRRRLGRHQRPRGTAGARDTSLAREPAGPAGGGHSMLAQGAGARGHRPGREARGRRRGQAQAPRQGASHDQEVSLTRSRSCGHLERRSTADRAEVKVQPAGERGPARCPGATWRFSRSPARAIRCCPSPTQKVAQIGDPIHILGFPGVVSSHELLNKSASGKPP